MLKGDFSACNYVALVFLFINASICQKKKKKVKNQPTSSVNAF